MYIYLVYVIYISIGTYALCMCIPTYVCMYVRMHVCMYACMHACMFVCVYVCNSKQRPSVRTGDVFQKTRH